MLDRFVVASMIIGTVVFGVRVLSDILPQPKPCLAEASECRVAYGAIDGLGHGPISKRPNRTFCTASDGTRCVRE